MFRQFVGLSAACALYGLWSWYNQPASTEMTLTPEQREFAANMANARQRALEELGNTLKLYHQIREERAAQGQANPEATAYVMLFIQPASWQTVEQRLQALRLDPQDQTLQSYVGQLQTLIATMRKTHQARLQCVKEPEQQQLHRNELETCLDQFEELKEKITQLDSDAHPRYDALRKVTRFVNSYRPHLRLFLDTPELSMDADLQQLWIKIEPANQTEATLQERLQQTSTHSIKAIALFSFEEQGWVDERTNSPRTWMKTHRILYAHGTPGWEKYAEFAALVPRTTSSWANTIFNMVPLIQEAFNNRP